MRRFGILGNPEGEELPLTLERLVRSLRSKFPADTICLARDISAKYAAENQGTKGITICDSLYDLASSSDLLFSLGGDGTMLMAARAIQHANPAARLIGVNLGKLGFLSENPPSELEAMLDDLLRHDLKGENRLMLQASVRSESKNEPFVKRDDLEPGANERRTLTRPVIALNEIVIDNYGSTRMLTLEVSVDGAVLGVMRADGIIVATPTGSTGYAVSAGGPIIEPTSPVLLITPIAPHSLNIRPIIVPEGCTVEVRASSDETNQALVVADGQEEIVVDTPSMITIGAAKERLRLLRRKDRSYFELLRTKLFWSMDHRGRK